VLTERVLSGKVEMGPAAIANHQLMNTRLRVVELERR
jgi:hypothetical protein